MSSSDIAVSVRGLSKSYTIAHEKEKHNTLAETMLDRLRHPFRKHEQETFWALNDVSFDIKKGDVVGIIGRNGAGKSTLLKILSRITEPTKGEIDLYGRVGSLLEVGTGFSGELTGRENIFLNGAILGMRRHEIQKHFDAIIDFAGVEQFLDTPVKRYSSGMYVRLAFAVAAHLNSDILIVDEVLAVGDAEFQRKCLGRMQDLAYGGRTVLFVSHNMNTVMALCSTAIHLKSGTVFDQGELKAVIDGYSTLTVSECEGDLSSHPGRSKCEFPALRQIRFEDENGNPTATFRAEEAVSIRITVRCLRRLHAPRLSLGFNNQRGERIFAIATYLSESSCGPAFGEMQFKATFQLPALMPGQYNIDIGLADGPSHFIDAIYSAAAIDVADSNYLGTAAAYFNEMGPVLVRSFWETNQYVCDRITN